MYLFVALRFAISPVGIAARTPSLMQDCEENERSENRIRALDLPHARSNHHTTVATLSTRHLTSFDVNTLKQGCPTFFSHRPNLQFQKFRGPKFNLRLSFSSKTKVFRWTLWCSLKRKAQIQKKCKDSLL